MSSKLLPNPLKKEKHPNLRVRLQTAITESSIAPFLVMSAKIISYSAGGMTWTHSDTAGGTKARPLSVSVKCQIMEIQCLNSHAAKSSTILPSDNGCCANPPSWGLHPLSRIVVNHAEMLHWRVTPWQRRRPRTPLGLCALHCCA